MPVCPPADAVSGAVLWVFPPESPAGCKSTHARQAHLINNAGALSGGGAAVVAAILLSNCSAFSLLHGTPIRGYFPLPKANQKHALV